MHKRLKLYFKKSAAIFTAAALTLTASSAMVFGAGSYQEEEKKAFSKSMENFPKVYGNVLEEYKAANAGVEVNFSIELEDAGRSLFSVFSSTDLSWLNKMDMQTKVIFKDGVEGVDINLLLNDTHICNLQTYLDIHEQNSIIKMPEIFDGYIRSSLTSNIYDENGNVSSVYSPYASEQFQTYMNFMMDISEYLPQVSTMETLLDRYGNLLIDHFSDTSSGEEELSLEEITQNCKVYEGRIYQDELTTLAEDILTTAKTDAELEEVINTWAEIMPYSKNIYQNYLESIDNSITNIRESESDADENAYVSSKIWVSEDDAVIGRQISLVDSTDPDIVITWQMPQKDGKFEYLLDFSYGDSRTSMTGNGSIDGAIMSGTYYLYSNSEPLFCIEMEGYDIEAAKEGYGKGTYTITPLPGIADAETYDILSNFSLIADFESNKTNSSMALSLLSAGSVLGTIRIDGTIGSDITIPEITDSDKVYDTSIEEDGAALAEDMSYDKILDNLREAGVPDELVAQLQASIEASLSSGADDYIEDDCIEDNHIEDDHITEE